LNALPALILSFIFFKSRALEPLDLVIGSNRAKEVLPGDEVLLLPGRVGILEILVKLD